MNERPSGHLERCLTDDSKRVGFRYAGETRMGVAFQIDCHGLFFWGTIAYQDSLLLRVDPFGLRLVEDCIGLGGEAAP
jgi:hypothetical protein